MMEHYLKLNDVHVYKIAFQLSNHVWNVVLRWNPLAKDTIGKQFIRAIDSISANIAEGFGRHFKKDKIKFYRISRGAIFEALDWHEKARIRTLLSEEQYLYILSILKDLPRELNQLIKWANEKLAH